MHGLTPTHRGKRLPEPRARRCSVQNPSVNGASSCKQPDLSPQPTPRRVPLGALLHDVPPERTMHRLSEHPGIPVVVDPSVGFPFILQFRLRHWLGLVFLDRHSHVISSSRGWARVRGQCRPGVRSHSLALFLMLEKSAKKNPTPGPSKPS